ncbi:unnamed protein product, partial [Brachionus calyciflorus]
DVPIFLRPYRISIKEGEFIRKEIQSMLDNGIIEVSTSPWSAPVVLIPKKDGSKRFCVDYRKLNQKTTETWPLPRVDDILARLNCSTYYSTLDLISGYWLVEMDSKSKEKTFYLDDIIIHSKSLEEHKEHIRLNAEALRINELKLKHTKCHWFAKKVKVLGFIVSGSSIEMDPAKVRAIVDNKLIEDYWKSKKGKETRVKKIRGRPKKTNIANLLNILTIFPTFLIPPIGFIRIDRHYVLYSINRDSILFNFRSIQQ